MKKHKIIKSNSGGLVSFNVHKLLRKMFNVYNIDVTKVKFTIKENFPKKEVILKFYR